MGQIVLRFILLGPLVGCFGFILADQFLSVAGLRISTLAQTEEYSGLLLSVPMLWLYGLILAYPLGVLPAALSGYSYSLFLRRRNENYYLYVRLFIGCVIGFILSGVVGALFSGSSLAIIPWLAAGGAGGAVAAGSIGKRLFVGIEQE